MSHVRKRRHPNGTVFYQACWHLNIMGKRKQQTKAFARQSDAKAYAVKMADEAEGRGIHDPNRYTFRSYMDHWLDQMEDRGEHSVTTLMGYRRNAAMLCRYFGEVPLVKLRALDLDIAYSALLSGGGKARDGSGEARPLKARTVHHIHRCAHTALRQAIKWRFLAHNPATDATPPQPQKSKARSLTKDERARVLQAARKASYPNLDILLATLAMTGLRRSEVLGLAWDCVDLDAGVIEVRRTVITGPNNTAIVREETKTETSKRKIPIAPELVELLRRQRVFISEQLLVWGKDYAREPLFVFPEAGGHVMKPDTLTTRLRSVNRSAGVKGAQPVHGHRHTAATVMLAKGADIKTVSVQLGHSTPAITMALYVHEEDERSRAAAALLGNVFEA